MPEGRFEGSHSEDSVVKAGAALLGGDDAASVELESALVGLDRHGNGLKTRGGQQDVELEFGDHGGMLKARQKRDCVSPFRRVVCRREAKGRDL